MALGAAPPFPNPSTIREAKLMCADVAGNHNKFYVLTLQQSSDGQYRCLCNYGRVGATGRLEVRAQGRSQPTAEAAFNTVYHQKTRSRYREVKTVGTATPVSAGVQRADAAWRSGVRAPANWPRPAQQFYNDLLHEATCLVETGMQVSNVSAVGLSTPLGLIGEQELKHALDTLSALHSAIATNDQARIDTLNSDFFSRIPTPIGGTRVRLRDQMITTVSEVADKEQLINTALGLIAAQQPASAPAGAVPPLVLDTCDQDELTELTALLRKERCSCHRNEALKPAQAFRVTRPSELSQFRTDLFVVPPAGVPQPLFHGTRRSTAAGILSRGFLPTNAARASGGNYSGSAFGDGIYFASNAGKSLGYTDGGVGKRILFVAYVAMGKAHYAGWGGNGFRRPASADRVHARVGGGLAHDEMIVPTPSQTLIAYVMAL